MTDFETLTNELDLAEINALAERGGHSESQVLTLFRRLRAGTSQVRGGDTHSLRDHLVMVHAPLVEHCARGFRSSGEPFDDLVQEGYVGLIKAVDRFDPDKGIKFSTYACHLISGEIRHYLRDLGRLIHEPGWHFELRGRIARASENLTSQTGTAPSPEEIAAHLSIASETVREVIGRGQTLHVDSLDATETETGEGQLSVLERYEAQSGGERRGDEGFVEDRQFLEIALPQLKELEQQAVRLFFFDELSKTEIARRLGISINYVSYLVKRGTESLRRILEATETLPAVQSTASALSQSQARGAFLLQLARTAASNSDERRGFQPPARVPALSKPSVTSLAQFASWIDDEVARVGRYGGEFSLLWFQIRNWVPVTKDLAPPDKRAATAAAANMVRRLCRGIDKVTALQSADPPGLHFLVLMPATGAVGQILGKRLTEAFARPDLPGVVAPLHTRLAYSICPDNGRIADELFVFLGERLA